MRGAHWVFLCIHTYIHTYIHTCRSNGASLELSQSCLMTLSTPASVRYTTHTHTHPTPLMHTHTHTHTHTHPHTHTHTHTHAYIFTHTLTSLVPRRSVIIWEKSACYLLPNYRAPGNEANTHTHAHKTIT